MTTISHGSYRIDSLGERSPGEMRLDAGESLFFLRQLELIDTQAYKVRYPALLGRQIIPTLAGVPDWAHVYTFRQFDQFGTAKLIANSADDLNAAEATGQEYSTPIRAIGESYGYDVFELQAAAASAQMLSNMPIMLEQLRASAARYACESAVDLMLAQGKIPMPGGVGPATVPGIFGLYNQPGATVFTPGAKALGGTTWGSIATPNATGDEVAADIMGIANNLFAVTQGIWGKFKIVLPISQYNYAATKRLGSVSDTTALAFAKANCPYIEDVIPWWQAPAGQMVAFPNDPAVLGALVNQEWTVMAPQMRNLKYVINTYMKCGGVVSRYPVAISTATGL